MKKNLTMCIMSILLAASGGLVIGLSSRDVFGVILILIGFSGMGWSFCKEYWRMVYDESDEMSQEIDS